MYKKTEVVAIVGRTLARGEVEMPWDGPIKRLSIPRTYCNARIRALEVSTTVTNMVPITVTMGSY
jgi:hypothetical protein